MKSAGAEKNSRLRFFHLKRFFYKANFFLIRFFRRRAVPGPYFFYKFVNQIYRKPDDVPVIAFDFFNKQRGLRLDGVSAGFIERLAFFYQKPDFFVVHFREFDARALQTDDRFAFVAVA